MMLVSHPVDFAIFETLTAAEACAQRIRSLMLGLGQTSASAQFYSRVRVKSYNSVIKKVYSKRREKGKSLYSPNMITDFVGVRIVTLYDDDIEQAVSYLWEIIKAGKSMKRPIFVPYRALDQDKSSDWDCIREALFYRRDTAGASDAYVAAHRDLLGKLEADFGLGTLAYNSHLKKITMKKAKGGEYSSIHVILNASASVGDRVIPVPVEFQIRTAVEDIWGEINHQLFYKAVDLFTWTSELGRLYVEMAADSKLLIKQFREVREPIFRFWRHSKEAEDAVMAFQRPTTTLHRSLVVTLFFAMDKERLDDVADLLRNYDDALGHLSKITDAAAAAVVITGCMNTIREVKSRFGRAIDEVAALRRKARGKGGKDSKLLIEKTLLEQRRKLCDLEIVRLKGLSIIFYNHKVGVNNPVILKTKKSKDRVSRTTFDSLCKFRNDPDLKVRPVAMMTFWKYSVLKTLDLDLANHHLKIAAEELAQDSSLPDWSIYRTLIPRHLAGATLAEARSLLKNNGLRAGIKKEEWWRSQIAVDVRSLLLRAYAFALESHRRSSEKDKRSGDLLFGYQLDESIYDADLIGDITLLYVPLFGVPDVDLLHTSVEFILQRLREAHEFLSKGEFTEMKYKGKVKQLAKTIRQLSKDEANNGGV